MMLSDVSSKLDSLLDSMRQHEDAPARDLTTDHGRWQLYVAAMRRPECVPLLIRAVGAETDPLLAAALAVRLLEIVPDVERDVVVGNLPAEQRVYSVQRMTELRWLDRIVSGSMGVDEFRRGLPEWSTWLHRRIAEQADGHDYLTMLAHDGRTKKVRALAASRSRENQPQNNCGVPGIAENPA